MESPNLTSSTMYPNKREPSYFIDYSSVQLKKLQGEVDSECDEMTETAASPSFICCLAWNERWLENQRTIHELQRLLTEKCPSLVFLGNEIL